MQLNPYLTFDGNCEEAMGFYRDCLGGEFSDVNYFKDGPSDMGAPEHLDDKIMHMELRFGDNRIMASDTMREAPPAGGNVTLNVSMDDVDAMEGVFQKLSAGGQVTMPLADTFWGARFGMFTDKYGVKWMFNCHTAVPAG